MTTTSTATVQRFWVNVSNQGTAMGETALCDDCQHMGTNALDMALLAMRQDDFGGRTARESVHNDALTCQACGRTATAGERRQSDGS